MTFDSNGGITGLSSTDGEAIAFGAAGTVNPADSGAVVSCAPQMCDQIAGAPYLRVFRRASCTCKPARVHCTNPTGAVECWLLEVEGCMKRAMHLITRDALLAYAKSPRTSWILAWPGQAVLTSSQVHWTREVTDAIQSGGSKGLTAYANKCVK